MFMVVRNDNAVKFVLDNLISLGRISLEGVEIRC